MIWDTECTGHSQARETAGTLAGKILNVLVMYWVGTCMVFCLFPCDVLVMYQLSTPVLAPSVCINGFGVIKTWFGHGGRGGEVC